MSSLPVYVTRKSAGGVTGDYSMSPGLAVTLFLLVVLNIAGWSVFGLIELALKVVNLFG